MSHHFVVNAFIDNLVMFFGTPFTIFFATRKHDNLRRWGGPVGCFVQVFYITANCSWERWGQLGPSVLCAALYAETVHRYWIKPYWGRLRK